MMLSPSTTFASMGPLVPLLLMNFFLLSFFLRFFLNLLLNGLNGRNRANVFYLHLRNFFLSVGESNAHLEQMLLTVELIGSLQVLIGGKANLISIFINVGKVHLRGFEVEFFLEELGKDLVVDLAIVDLDDLVVLEGNLHVV